MRLNRLWPVLAGMLCFGLVGALQAHAQGVDGSVTLMWTAPGDDSLTGTAMRYDIRYSLFPITEESFVYSAGVGGLPPPALPGTIQQFTVYGLLPGIRYYFALKTADERLNWSRMSNVIAFAGNTVSVGPGTGRALAFSAPMPNPARSSTSFQWSTVAPARVRVEIFDVQGRVVNVLANGPQSQTEGLLRWDLRDLTGRTVPAGVYLARARLGDTVITRRILVQR
jgi:hypothetical protein